MTIDREREKFSSEELARCLSHYDLGAVHQIREFPRGSRRAPKVIVESDNGRFLLKRRAKGKNNLDKVAFTHQIQIMLAAQNYPLPHLLGTKEENNSLLILDENVYELFEFISGGGYDGSLEATHHSGRILGLYHKLLEDFDPEYDPPRGSYHNAKAIHQAIRNTVGSIPMEVRPPSEVLTQTVGSVEQRYLDCAEAVNKLGLDDWPEQIVHGDWHPGNMLFKEHRVVAVIDYDAARLQQRVIDLANGALQFSIIGGDENPAAWPDYLDESRFKRFVRAYDDINVISTAELQAVPYLMCEAMIAEGVLPIAATGSFGRFQGFQFLQMISRKIDWILSHKDELVAIVTD
jgi:homoserine kinase type II